MLWLPCYQKQNKQKQYLKQLLNYWRSQRTKYSPERIPMRWGCEMHSSFLCLVCLRDLEGNWKNKKRALSSFGVASVLICGAHFLQVVKKTVLHFPFSLRVVKGFFSNQLSLWPNVHYFLCSHHFLHIWVGSKLGFPRATEEKKIDPWKLKESCSICIEKMEESGIVLISRTWKLSLKHNNNIQARTREESTRNFLSI